MGPVADLDRVERRMFPEASELGRVRGTASVSCPRQTAWRRPGALRRDRDRLPPRGRAGADTEVRLRARVRPRRLPADVVDGLGAWSRDSPAPTACASPNGSPKARWRVSARASRRRYDVKPRAIVVGSGAGGATAARALQGTFDVTVLEAGGRSVLCPSTSNDRAPEALASGVRPEADPCPLPRDPRQPHARRDGARERFVRRRDDDDRDRQRPADGRGSPGARSRPRRGVRGDPPEIPVSTAHRRGWHATTRRLFDVFDDIGLDPMPMPKMGDPERCRHCGRCVLGCPKARSGMPGGSSKTPSVSARAW